VITAFIKVATKLETMIRSAYKTMVARKSFTAAEIRSLDSNDKMFEAYAVANMLLSTDGYECKKDRIISDIYNYDIEYTNRNDDKLNDDEKRKILLTSRMDDIDEGNKVKRLTHGWEFRCPDREAINHINRIRGSYHILNFDVEIE
jgi:hypothetical protein